MTRGDQTPWWRTGRGLLGLALAAVIIVVFVGLTLWLATTAAQHLGS
ncbi:hypothetical protein NY547_17000 [Cnuibacter physcomitrellae]|nr:hypothetical protein [Cnuibacter physcomitrellae]MCS5498950.1 hypothetical protein [Cnuibacter physcomitrellae]